MTDTQTRLYHPTRASDRVAVVSVRPASSPGQFLVQVALGASRHALTNTRMFGPYDVDAATKLWQDAVAKLREAGYGSGGTAALVDALRSKSPKKRARAAQAAGWRRDLGTVEVLLERAANPREDIGSVLHALARMDETRAIPFARLEADKKLLWRRRAGVEALRLLGDDEGLAAARARAIERLPVAAGEHTVDALVALALADKKEAGLAADTLYELGTATSVDAARRVIAKLTLARAGTWRYVKSVLKRALIRMDGETVGALIHQIELASRATKGTDASVKSGLDGETRTVRILSRPTADYLRRLVWRWLTRIAKYDAGDFGKIAAWLLVPYRGMDDVVPKGRMPRTGQSYLLHRILYGSSKRFELQWRNLRMLLREGASHQVASGVREEAEPSLWDAAPEAYLTLLARARHPLVTAFAARAVKARHPDLLRSATTEELELIFAQDDDAIALLALPELRRRFDHNAPDLALVGKLLASESERARALGLAYLTDSAHVWTRDAACAVAFLSIPHEAARETAARLFIASARSLSPEVRSEVAARIVMRVGEPEPIEGAHMALAEAARALAAEITAWLTTDVALALLARGTDAAELVASLALLDHPGTYDALGHERVIAYLGSERVVVRKVALYALRQAPAGRDLVTIMQVAESDWADVRIAAGELLAALDATGFDVARWMMVLDATRPEIQAAARRLLSAHIERVETSALITRLAEHPDREMRRFVIGLAIAHLPAGAEALSALLPVLRGVLFDVRPSRELRTRVLDLLALRGLASEDEGLLAAAVLSDVVRSATHDVRERALRALVELQLTWPILTHAASPVSLVIEVA